jgi:CheY-like chemotaxis protein
MSAPTITWSPTNPSVNPLKKKRVLLVDTSRTKRDLRSETMRKLGLEVDCAADIVEARSWWRADLYDLVLINVDDGTGPRDKFCEDVRAATPPQQIMFLVGKPAYLSASPNVDSTADAPVDTQSDEVGPALWKDVKTALASTFPGGIHQRWGILEACRRISAVRSVSEARSKALRNRPEPPRDFEISQLKRADQAEILDRLMTEKTQ